MPIERGMSSAVTACDRNRMNALRGLGTWLGENLRPCFFLVAVALGLGGSDGTGWCSYRASAVLTGVRTRGEAEAADELDDVG